MNLRVRTENNFRFLRGRAEVKSTQNAAKQEFDVAVAEVEALLARDLAGGALAG